MLADGLELGLPGGEMRPWNAAYRQTSLVLGGIAGLSLLSALWLYASYNGAALLEGRAPRISFGDALGTGVLHWGLWAPFLLLAVRLARRWPLVGGPHGRGGIARVVATYGLAAVGLSLAQLTLFALASVALRRLLYEQDPAWTLGEIVLASLWSAFYVKFRTGVLVSLAVLCGVNVVEAWRRLREREQPRVQPPASPSVANAFKEREEPAPGKLVARAGGRVAHLLLVEIDWIEAAGNYLRIHAGGRLHLTRGTLRDFLATHGEHGFVRVHRSTLVRAECIALVSGAGSGDLELELRDGTRLRASRRYRAAIDALSGDARPGAARPSEAAVRPRTDAAAAERG